MIDSYKRAEFRSPIGRELRGGRVHVVDHDPASFEAVRGLARAAGLRPVRHRTGQDLLDQLAVDQPSCVVLEVREPGGGGLTTLGDLRAAAPDVPVVMTSGNADVATVLDAIRRGAVDFLEKPFYAEELFERVLAALEISRASRARSARRVELERRIAALTPREHEVMALLTRGKTVKEIAYGFGLSHKTVQVHRARVLKRLQVDSVVILTNLLHELEIDLTAAPDGTACRPRNELPRRLPLIRSRPVARVDP